jgi:UDP-xylose/UDP-N-acetylglucosamine transporter B4
MPSGPKPREADLQRLIWDYLQDISSSSASEGGRSAFGTGLLILLVAQVLSAIMGLHTEEVYKTYGPRWQENLFYSHALSLPLFLPLAGSLRAQFRRLSNSPPMNWAWEGDVHAPVWMSGELLQAMNGISRIPSKLVYLAANVLAQFACIRGVNLLAAASSALTVTIVLNIRKLISLLLSIWLFGNRLAVGTIVGAVIVFSAGALYTLESRPRSTNKTSNNPGPDNEKQRVD